MIKSRRIVKKSHENVILCDKKSPHSGKKKVMKMQIYLIKSNNIISKRHKNVNIGDKKSETSEKTSEKCKFRGQKVTT